MRARAYACALLHLWPQPDLNVTVAACYGAVAMGAGCVGRQLLFTGKGEGGGEAFWRCKGGREGRREGEGGAWTGDARCASCYACCSSM